MSIARRLFPDAPAPWIDLSTGINPHPYPIGAISPEAWARLPDAETQAELESTAARRYGARSGELVAGPGSQAIIQALARLIPARRVGVLAPTYSGHARAWSAAGAAVENVDRLERLADYDVAVVVNPNNPDGRILAASRLRELAKAMAARGGWLIVDEAFADFDGAAQSLASDLPESGALALRSFGKTYGLAGLRLGFALAPRDLARRLRAALGPWSVGGPALEIGARALRDDDWLAQTASRLRRDATRLDALLIGAGWNLIGGACLFRLARRDQARSRFRSLLRAGLLARPFADAPDRLRFGLPPDELAWERLAAALKQNP